MLASPTIGTTADPSDVTLDSSGSPTLKDSATLAGGYNATGSITFTLYAPDGTTVLDTETVTVSGNGTYSTPTGYTLPTTGTVTGTYQWVASYGGDRQQQRRSSIKGDEPVTVDPASPTISTTTDPTEVTVGTVPFNDSATLAGGLQSERHDHLHAVRGRRHDRAVHRSRDGERQRSLQHDRWGQSRRLRSQIAGTYEWVASYGGDGNNTGVASTVGDEPVIATTASAFLTTSASPSSVTLGTAGRRVLNDSATLAGGSSPTGSITFSLYSPDGRRSWTPRR